MHRHFVRIGSQAEIYLGVYPTRLDRGRRVIVRTTRGTELGEVTGPCGAGRGQPDRRALAILRATTPEDELLIRRLERHKRDAVEACRDELSRAGCEAVLLDVEQLFDGGTLLMQFLGPVDPLAESIAKGIAERYESVVRSRHFAKLLHDGCGPDCGSGDSCGSCGHCAGCGLSGPN